MPKKNTIEILERRKTMIDALIALIKKCPNSVTHAHAKGLDGGKNGLSFPEYALIVPYWNKGDIQLRLLKSGEDWMNLDSDVERLVSEDVSKVSDNELKEILDGMHRESNPDEEDEEQHEK